MCVRHSLRKTMGLLSTSPASLLNIVSCKPLVLCTQGCRGTLTCRFCPLGVNSVNNHQSSGFYGPAALLVFRTVIGISAGPLNCWQRLIYEVSSSERVSWTKEEGRALRKEQDLCYQIKDGNLLENSSYTYTHTHTYWHTNAKVIATGNCC